MHSGRFFVRRMLKIWPLFYLAFIFHYLYFYLKDKPPPGSQVMAELFFIQNYRPGFMPVTWSLGIEEQFYLFVAIVLPLLVRFGKIRWVVPGCVLIMIMSFSLRILYYFTYAHYDRHYALQFRADSLSAGIVISWFYNFNNESFKKWIARNSGLLLLFSISLLVPVFVFPGSSKWITTIGFSTTWMGYGALVILFIGLPTIKNSWGQVFNKNKLAMAIAWVGFYSYAIYLFHFFIGLAVLSNFRSLIWSKPPVLVQFLVFLAADIIFGFLISYFFEQPILKWRNRVFPSNDTQRVQKPVS